MEFQAPPYFPPPYNTGTSSTTNQPGTNPANSNYDFHHHAAVAAAAAAQLNYHHYNPQTGSYSTPNSSQSTSPQSLLNPHFQHVLNPHFHPHHSGHADNLYSTYSYNNILRGANIPENSHENKSENNPSNMSSPSSSISSSSSGIQDSNALAQHHHQHGSLQQVSPASTPLNVSYSYLKLIKIGKFKPLKPGPSFR